MTYFNHSPLYFCSMCAGYYNPSFLLFLLHLLASLFSHTSSSLICQGIDLYLCSHKGDVTHTSNTLQSPFLPPDSLPPTYQQKHRSACSSRRQMSPLTSRVVQITHSGAATRQGAAFKIQILSQVVSFVTEINAQCGCVCLINAHQSAAVVNVSIIHYTKVRLFFAVCLLHFGH